MWWQADSHVAGAVTESLHPDPQAGERDLLVLFYNTDF